MSAVSDAKIFPLSSSVASLFADCLNLFRQLYLTLAREGCQVKGQVSLSKVGDGYGRLGVWGGDSGAQRSGRGSLDDALRHEPHLRSIVLDLLGDLINDLKRAIQIAEDNAPSGGLQSSENDSGQDSASSSSSESDATSDDAAVGDVETPRPRRTGFQHVVGSIFDDIRSLYKLSTLLRRPSVPNKYIRSVSKDQEISHFARWDQAHVEARYNVAGPELVRRLGLANTRRRQQLKHWEKHPDRSELDQPRIKLPQESPNITLGSNRKNLSGPWQQQQQQQRTVSDAVVESSRSLGVPSQTTRNSFSTVDLSTLNDNGTSSAYSRTVYEPSVQIGLCSSRVPDLPKVPLGASSVRCPFCFATLELKAVQKRHLWKKHVFRDLRPYVCTFENCPNPEQLYVTRHDWLYHESQVHRRRWVCAHPCGLNFASKALLGQHMKEHHPDKTSEIELPMLLDMCERPASSDEKDACPLCSEELTLLELRSHLAAHLEDLALFVLPAGIDEESNDAASDIAEAPQQPPEYPDDDEQDSSSNSPYSESPSRTDEFEVESTSPRTQNMLSHGLNEAEASKNSIQNAADFTQLSSVGTSTNQVDSWLRETIGRASSQGSEQWITDDSLGSDESFEEEETPERNWTTRSGPYLPTPTITRKDVELHNTPESCYVIRGTKAYDVTPFLDDHPGGGELILEYGGKDVTDVMGDEVSHSHSDAAYEFLDENYLLGSVATESDIGKIVDNERLQKSPPLPLSEEDNQVLERLNKISYQYHDIITPQCTQVIARNDGPTCTEYEYLTKTIEAEVIDQCLDIGTLQSEAAEALWVKKQEIIDEACTMLEDLDEKMQRIIADRLNKILNLYYNILTPYYSHAMKGNVEPSEYMVLITSVQREVINKCVDIDTYLFGHFWHAKQELLTRARATLETLNAKMQAMELEELGRIYHELIAPACTMFVSQSEKLATKIGYNRLKELVSDIVDRCSSMDMNEDADMQLQHQKLVGEAADMLQSLDKAMQNSPAKQIEEIARTYLDTLAPKCLQFTFRPPREEEALEAEYKELSNLLLVEVIDKCDNLKFEMDVGTTTMKLNLVEQAQAMLSSVNRTFKHTATSLDASASDG